MVEGDPAQYVFEVILLARLEATLNEGTQTRRVTPVMVIVVDSVTSADEFGFSCSVWPRVVSPKAVLFLTSFLKVFLYPLIILPVPFIIL